ncbi:hypothetical protein MNBD_GAMMA21-2720 [hydrothermal vent metagenome]|uniref:Cytochrome c-552/4 domain-containing protein n=1 Tax=hydrothermal vent metagenome TaxID=652676 RepID=A0A3B1A5D2_9ZZZZ
MAKLELKLLTSRQRSIFMTALVLAAIMVVNTLYLLAASYIEGIGENPEVLPLTYQYMLVIHITLGIIFSVFGISFALSHLKKVFRLKTRGARMSGGLIFSSVALLLVSGFFILSEANSQANQWIFIAHQVSAGFLVTMYLVHRLVSRDPPRKANAIGGGVVITVLFLAAWLTHHLELTNTPTDVVSLAIAKPKSSYATDDKRLQISDRPEIVKINPFVPFKALGDPDPDSVFFPAKTTTDTGGFLASRIITHDDLPDLDAFRAETKEKGFAPSYFLGAQSCQTCHADIVEQWSKSAHRFASFNNPFYRKSVELTRDAAGKKKSQFCGGCHDPAIMLAGNMTKEIDPLTPESQAGLTCLACHAIDRIHDRTGNGNYNIHDRTESPYIFAQSKKGLKKLVHDYILKAKPTAHKNRLLKPVFKKGEYCLTCHKVNLDVQVNGYRWLRAQNEYDGWHNSGITHNNPMTWYEPETKRQCQDCHMPREEVVLGDVSAKDGSVRSHRFIAANTALPYIRGDKETIARIVAFMQDKKLRVDIFALHREDGTIIMPVNNELPVLYPGEVVQFDVVVRNQGVGHNFPGGTNDSNEGWIDFSASINNKNVFQSGAVLADKTVDPGAHFYRAVLVDKNGLRINKRNGADIYTSIYANVIPPSNSDIARYQFKVPDDAEGREIKVNATLLWRKFDRFYTEFVFEGKEVPDLPITTIASNHITLRVAARDTGVEPKKKIIPEEWYRFNDYGIGLLRDSDTRGAIKAFEQVALVVPEKMDGWLNQARVLMKDGSLKKAEAMLRKASAAEPDQPRLAFFWGRLLEKSGRFDGAIQAYRRTLQTYPESRDTWARLGRTYWLDDQVEDSIRAYLEVLKIDPEHAQAFHQLSLAYKHLAAVTDDVEEKKLYAFAAQESETAFKKYKLDENAQKVTRAYRQKHPYDNKMSQLITIHGAD